MTNLPSYDFLMLQLKLKGIWQRRSLGQHFLTDPEMLRHIAESADAGPQALAVEIGPGPGTLTTELAARAGGVLAVEFDTRLRELHGDAFKLADNVEFHYADALKVDLQAEAAGRMRRSGLTEAVLTGNLPFQITSPLLFGQCGPGVLWKGITVMIQREVADRICALPGNRDYGILTVKLAYWWSVVERFEAPAWMFFPRPKVDASVLAFKPQADADLRVTPEEWPGLSDLIDAAFSQRRKMLLNSLAARWRLFPGKEAALAALEALGVSPQARAENLSPFDFLKLYRLVANGRK